MSEVAGQQRTRPQVGGRGYGEAGQVTGGEEAKLLRPGPGVGCRKSPELCDPKACNEGWPWGQRRKLPTPLQTCPRLRGL